jgi:lysophospholipase
LKVDTENQLIIDKWTAADGWPLRRARIAPKGAARRGSLLFLNGRGDHLEKYIGTMAHWAAGGWQVEGFDWRGQGGSGRFHDDSTIGHVDDFTCWLDDFADYAAEWLANGAAPHVMIGHSMGGHLLLRAMAEQRVRCDAAVLVAPMLGIAAGGLPAPFAGRIVGAACSLGHARRSLWSSRARFTPSEAAARLMLTHSAERLEEEALFRREHPELTVDAPSWGWLRAAYRSIALMDRDRLVEQIETPVLILASRGDRLVSTPAIVRTAARLRHHSLHLYGRHVAHEILREIDEVRDNALARIDAFFADHAPSQAESARA